MLILAGVSLNAIVGDNGIITNAQKANILSSIAYLQDFFSEKYVETFDNDLSSEESRIKTFFENYSEWFYIPKNEVGIPYDCIYGDDGKVYYLIKKENLPNEIKKSLVGGDANDKSYDSYRSLKDVYGLTSDLKVYYCSDGIDSIMGISISDLDNDNPFRTIYSSENDKSVYDLIETYDLDKDGNINNEEMKNINNFNITGNSSTGEISKVDFKNLSKLINLDTLKIENVHLDNLDGIGYMYKLKNIYIKNSIIDDFNNFSAVNNKVELISISESSNEQVIKLCNEMKKSNFIKLKTFEIYNSGESLNDISIFNSLTQETKDSITTLNLSSNGLIDVAILKDFNNLISINLNNNKIENLYDALLNKKKLNYLYVADNNLTDSESENIDISLQCLGGLITSKNLKEVNLSNNKNLRYLTGLTSHTNYSFDLFYLQGCSNLISSEVSAIADIYNKAYAYAKNIDSKYKDYLNTSSKLVYSKLNNSNDNYVYLKGLSQDKKNKVAALSIENSTDLTNDEIQNLLLGYNNLTSLNLNGCSKLNSLDFLKHMSKLKEILFKDTDITGSEVSLLDLYCPNLVCLECNNPGIDITKMQKTLSNLRRDIHLENSFYSVGGTRIYNLASQFGKCTDLTFFEPTGLNYNGVVDLSNCKNSIGIGFYGEGRRYKICNITRKC